MNSLNSNADHCEQQQEEKSPITTLMSKNIKEIVKGKEQSKNQNNKNSKSFVLLYLRN